MKELTPEELMEAAKSLPNTDKLVELGELANKLIGYHQKREDLEADLAVEMEKIRKIEHELLPDLMVQVGMSEFTTTGGTKIKRLPVYSCGISKENQQDAFAWLRLNDFGSLIKHTFTVAFGMNEEKMAEKCKVTLHEAHIPFEDKEAVHASTLKALVKELYEKGTDFPEEIFGAYTKTVAQIEKTKKQKNK